MTAAESAETSAPAVPGPSRSQSMQLRWRRARRTALGPLVLVAVTALAIGVLVGRAMAPTVDDTAIAVVERDVVGLAIDADALWTAGGNDLPGVGRQLQQLRLTGDPAAVAPHVAGWLEGYDTVLRRLVGVDVPPGARPVQRQFVSAVTLARDAVEVLAAAAEVDDPAARRDLTSEALRLRIRAEEATQTAQASLRDLDGRVTGGVAEPAQLPSIAELR